MISIMKKKLSGLPVFYELKSDPLNMSNFLKMSSFLNNKNEDPNSLQAISKNIAVRPIQNYAQEEDILTRDINFMMDYAIDCFQNKHPNQMINENDEKSQSGYRTVFDNDSSLKKTKIIDLECYLLWMMFNYDFHLHYNELLSSKLNSLPYQVFDESSNQTLPNGRKVNDKSFLYSKLNELINKALGRIIDKLNNLDADYNQYKGDTCTNGCFIQDPKTGLGIFIKYRTETTTYHIYEMVLPNGKLIDISKYGNRLVDFAKTEQSNSNLTATPDFFFVSKTLSSYYSCILKDFQTLCVKLKEYKDASNNEKRAKRAIFFFEFRAIMQRRIKGEIKELLEVSQNNDTLAANKKYKYIVKIDGFDTYFTKLLINGMALKKAMVDTFGKDVGLKQIETLFDFEQIGVLFDLHISKDFQEYKTSRLYELNEELEKEFEKYNAQLEEESKQQELQQELQQNINTILNIAPLLSNDSKSRQPIDMNLATQLASRFDNSMITLPTIVGPQTNIMPDQNQQAMSDKSVDDSDPIVLDGKNQIDENQRLEEEKRQKELEREKLAKANETKSNIVLWSTVGLIGALGFGYYYYNKKKNDTSKE